MYPQTCEAQAIGYAGPPVIKPVSTARQADVPQDQSVIDRRFNDVNSALLQLEEVLGYLERRVATTCAAVPVQTGSNQAAPTSCESVLSTRLRSIEQRVQLAAGSVINILQTTEL